MLQAIRLNEHVEPSQALDWQLIGSLDLAELASSCDAAPQLWPLLATIAYGRLPDMSGSDRATGPSERDAQHSGKLAVANGTHGGNGSGTGVSQQAMPTSLWVPSCTPGVLRSTAAGACTSDAQGGGDAAVRADAAVRLHSLAQLVRVAQACLQLLRFVLQHRSAALHELGGQVSNRQVALLEAAALLRQVQPL